MPSNSSYREDQAAILVESKRFRDFLMRTSMRWSRRSGIRRAADIVCDELAMVITGNRTRSWTRCIRHRDRKACYACRAWHSEHRA